MKATRQTALKMLSEEEFWDYTRGVRFILLSPGGALGPTYGTPGKRARYMREATPRVTGKLRNGIGTIRPI